MKRDTSAHERIKITRSSGTQWILILQIEIDTLEFRSKKANMRAPETTIFVILYAHQTMDGALRRSSIYGLSTALYWMPAFSSAQRLYYYMHRWTNKASILRFNQWIRVECFCCQKKKNFKLRLCVLFQPMWYLCSRYTAITSTHTYIRISTQKCTNKHLSLQ